MLGPAWRVEGGAEAELTARGGPGGSFGSSAWLVWDNYPGIPIFSAIRVYFVMASCSCQSKKQAKGPSM